MLKFVVKLVGSRDLVLKDGSKQNAAKIAYKCPISLETTIEIEKEYIIRNTFSLEKMSYIPVCRAGTGREETATVIYHSRMSRGKNKKNFQLSPRGYPG